MQGQKGKRHWLVTLWSVVLGGVFAFVSFSFSQSTLSLSILHSLVSDLASEGKVERAEGLLLSLRENPDPLVSFKAKRLYAELLRQKGEVEILCIPACAACILAPSKFTCTTCVLCYFACLARLDECNKQLNRCLDRCKEDYPLCTCQS